MKPETSLPCSQGHDAGLYPEPAESSSHSHALFKIHYNTTTVITNDVYCRAQGYGLDDRGSRVRFPMGAGNFSLHHRVQNGSRAHPASYPMGTRGSFPGVQRPGREADHSPPSSAEVKEYEELYLHSPNTPSWRGAVTA
jgi:hypothetical protein